MRFTLDTNCIIDVEDERPNAPFVRELVGLHGLNGINVAVSAIGASERQRTGGYAQNFSDFKAKLTAVGFASLELLPPLGYWDLCFWDYFVWADENDTLEREIHHVLFPNIEFLWPHYAVARGLAVETPDKNWRNAKCDVLSLWCHVKHGGGVFVTSDDNFHSKTKIRQLQALGAGAIAFPKDALELAKTSDFAI
jgi:hypothetical protein